MAKPANLSDTWGELAEHAARSSDTDTLLARVRVLGLPIHVVWQSSRIQRELARLVTRDHACTEYGSYAL